MRHLDAINQILAPDLNGEQVTHATAVLVEKSVVQLSSAIAVGVTAATAFNSSEDVGQAFNPGGFLALAETHVYALNNTGVKARPKELVFAMDRAGLSCERGSKRLMGMIKLDTITLKSGDFEITFHVPKNAKADGQAFLNALGA